MKETLIQVKTQMDAKVFSDFSHFNAFYFQNRWIGLLIFPLLMFGLGLINRVTGSEFLFVIFCICAILMPSAYLIFYKISLARQIETYQLKMPHPVYTVELSKDGVTVSTLTEQTFFKWQQVYRVFECDDYTYIYISKARAFILPLKDLEESSPAVLHQVFVDFLPPIRLFNKKSKKY